MPDQPARQAQPNRRLHLPLAAAGTLIVGARRPVVELDGAPGIYIITPILNIGFNAARLCRLVRAEGAGSAIQDTQVPGRVSRRNDEKSGGRVDDFLDEFDPRGYGRKAATRRDNYNLHGWKQIFPPAPVLPKRASRAPVKGDRP